MQKVMRFLEAKVEWLALVIAVGFLGWCAWTYLINDPVSKTLENTPVGPANVDAFIDSHAAQRLREKMDPNATPPSFQVDDFTKAIELKIGLDNVQPPQFANANFDYAPYDASVTNGLSPRMGPPVVQLPTIPTAQPLLAASSLNTLAPAASGNGASPAANTAPAKGKDVRLVVAAFTIPWNDIFTQWNTSFGPEKPGQPFRLNPAGFQIVQITAYRSEKI